MKRLIFVFWAILVTLSAVAQKRTTITDILRVSDEISLNGRRITRIEVDSTFPSASHLRVPTVKAVRDYIAANGPGISDGDKGDITVTGSGATWTIDNLVVTGAKIAANAIDSSKIATGAVRSSDIGDGQVWRVDIAADAVDSTKISTGAVRSSDIGDGQVWTSDLGNGVVTGAKMAQQGATTGQVWQWNGSNWAPATVSGGGGVSDGDKGDITVTGSGATWTIDALVVTGAKIAADAVDSTKISTGAVRSSDIGDGQVWTSDLGNGVVTGAKIAQQGATNGQVLKWNGSAWAPGADAGVTGSGSDGQVAYWSSGTITGENLAFWDAANKRFRLGGSGSPTARLQVVGEGNTNATWLAQFHNSSGNNNQLMLRNDGYIGFGTASPTSPIHITGTFTDPGGNTPYLRINPNWTPSSAASSTQIASVRFDGSFTQTNSNQLLTGIQMNYLFNSGGFAYNQSQRGAALSLNSDAGCFYGNQSKSTGEVNTDPAFFFVQNGSLNSGSAMHLIKQNAATGEFIYMQQGNSSVGTTRFLRMENDGTTADAVASFMSWRWKFSRLQQFGAVMHQHAADNFGFYLFDGMGNFPMTTWRGKTIFNSTAGIGISDPVSVVRIRGTGATSGTYSLLVTNSSDNTTTATIAGRDDGFVGFGTNNPQRRLHVAGGARIETLNADTPTRLVGADADGDLAQLSSGTAGHIAYWDGASWITGSANLFWNNSLGRMGINTNTPQNTFHVNGGLRVGSSTGTATAFAGFNSSGDMSSVNNGGDVFIDGSGIPTINNGAVTATKIANATILPSNFFNTSMSYGMTLTHDGTSWAYAHPVRENYNNITGTTSPITLSSNRRDNLVNQGSTQSSFTFNLPASPPDGFVCKVVFANAVTTLTISGNGNTVLGTAPTSASIGTALEYKYYSSASAWVRIQ